MKLQHLKLQEQAKIGPSLKLLIWDVPDPKDHSWTQFRDPEPYALSLSIFCGNKGFTQYIQPPKYSKRLIVHLYSFLHIRNPRVTLYTYKRQVSALSMISTSSRHIFGRQIIRNDLCLLASFMFVIYASYSIKTPSFSVFNFLKSFSPKFSYSLNRKMVGTYIVSMYVLLTFVDIRNLIEVVSTRMQHF